MKTLSTAKTYLCVALVLHVAATVVAVHSVNAAVDYWSQFLQGMPFPVLFEFVVAATTWLPLFSVAIVLAGVFAVIKTTARGALNSMVAITVEKRDATASCAPTQTGEQEPDQASSWVKATSVPHACGGYAGVL